MPSIFRAFAARRIDCDCNDSWSIERPPGQFCYLEGECYINCCAPAELYHDLIPVDEHNLEIQLGVHVLCARNEKGWVRFISGQLNQQ